MLLPASLTVVLGETLPALGFAHTEAFDPARVDPVRNKVSVSGKPVGGVWLGELHADGQGRDTTAWQAWHGAEGTALTITRVGLAPDARVLRLDSAADLDVLTEALPAPQTLADYLGVPEDLLSPGMGRLGALCDWERLAAVVDAVWATETCVTSTRRRLAGPSLHTWDVASVLAFDGRVVEPR